MSVCRASATLAFWIWIAPVVFLMTVSMGQTQTPQAVLSQPPPTWHGAMTGWYKKSELDRAMADFNIALTFDARCANAYLLRGLVKQDRGDSEGALEDFDRAIEVQPRLAEAYNNRA